MVESIKNDSSDFEELKTMSELLIENLESSKKV